MRQFMRDGMDIWGVWFRESVFQSAMNPVWVFRVWLCPHPAVFQKACTFLFMNKDRRGVY